MLPYKWHSRSIPERSLTRVEAALYPKGLFVFLESLPQKKMEPTNVFHRFRLVAALCAAMFLGGATIASAGSLNIQFTDLTLADGVGTSVVSTVSIDGVSQPGTFTATALFSTLPGQFTFSGTSELVKLTFNPQIASFASSALYLGSAVSWTVAPALIPTGQTVTGVELSLSSSDLKKGSGSYAGTITIDTAAVPEPSSMMMASTAFIALGGLWRLRARRRKA
jgi:hypothetical protein